ncbi:hypothetical protein [Phytomonospora endophytica]|uniref:Uncharacterized protein n=1 Tax=Phytomonospora endophytica TaxID=714109 RepID=A0A841G766_9ACTN|nr:hypothetical protein [Phytomonospora endophytica]MBB6039910.1 hypothetical protein [Phytomonospora endophytica]GIG71020.1 hypothetical protein Pen01_73150 [Phytomonospora endophytica]
MDELCVFDVGGVKATLRELRLSDDREGMLEGTPLLHRKMRLMQLEPRRAANQGLHIDGLDAIRADVEARTETWLPRMRAEARLTRFETRPDSPGLGRAVLSVLWFQSPGDDAFTRLAAIVAPLDWTALSLFEPDDGD